MKKLLCLFALLATLATACTTIEIPTAYGSAKVTAPVFLTTQNFELTRTSDTLGVKYTRGTDPQASTLVSSAVSAAVTAAKASK
ncbi:TPA: hypothetical protein DDW35_11870 [Candidatus Sumerlaeota bacterium]|nr:hypothetical protein [Candidatus Sumerlaeota bacterium]